jgi:hypothetical protein
MIDCPLSLDHSQTVCTFQRAELGRGQCYRSMSVCCPQDDGSWVVSVVLGLSLDFVNPILYNIIGEINFS